MQVCRSSLLSSRNVRWRVACWPLVSHRQYADGTDRQTDGRTDGRQTVTLLFNLDVVSVITSDVKVSRPDWHRGQTFGLGLELLASASASRHCGLGLKVLASALNQNLTSCSISLLVYLIIMCYTLLNSLCIFIQSTLTLLLY